MNASLTGQCHCGAVRFTVQPGEALSQPVRCNCSLCRRRGATMIAVPKEALTVTAGREQLSLYQWNKQIAEHYFCSHCGTYTFHGRRADPTQYAVNVACLEDVELDKLPPAKMLDGSRLD